MARCLVLRPGMQNEDLGHMGMMIVSYTIKDVSDEQGYLKAIGAKRTAEVKAEARIGQATSARNAAVKEAQAQESSQIQRWKNEVQVAASNRARAIKEADYEVEIQTKRAEADMSYPLQDAIQQQGIVYEKIGEKIVERAKQIQIQEQEIIKMERTLDATVKKVAKAKKYEIETGAEAGKNSVVLNAQAQSESRRATGEAQAFAIAAKAQAEAEAMQKKADAFKDYKDAAVIDMILQTMPKVAAEVANPLTKVGKVTMVAGKDGDVGAARLTGEVVKIMDMVPSLVRDMTGVDILDNLKGATNA